MCFNVHRGVRDADDGDVIIALDVEDQVLPFPETPIPFRDIVPLSAKIRIVGEPLHALCQGVEVVPRSIPAPTIQRVVGYSVKILQRPRCEAKRCHA